MMINTYSTTEARVLIESGFYESQTRAVRYPNRAYALDLLGLDLAFWPIAHVEVR